MKIEITCSECRINFLKRSDKVKDNNFCSKSCFAKYRKGRARGNGEWAILGRAEYMRRYLKKYTENNKEAHNERGKKWAKNNKEKRKQALTKWQKNNKDKTTATANRRRARKLLAIPKWSNPLAVEHFYTTAKSIEDLTGLKVHVDHIIPLQGKNVCGLHCEHNLRVMWAEDNLKKGIKFDSDDGRFIRMTHGLTKKENGRIIVSCRN